MKTVILKIVRTGAPTWLLTLLWFIVGCASGSLGELTFKELDTNVGWKMEAFRTVDPLGGIPANQEKQVAAAHQAYQQAFQRALAAAGGNLNAAAPPDLVNQANQLIALISNVLGNP